MPDKFKRYANGPFVCGSSNLRHDTLAAHERSCGHKDAEIFIKAKTAKNGETPAEKSIQVLNSVNLKRLELLFMNAHAVAKRSRTIADYVWMCSLDEKKGLDLGKTYRNNHSCANFMKAISEVEKSKIEKQIEKAKFLTILSDGSSDISVIENEIVYIHFSLNGNPHCYFIGLVSVEQGNAKGIMKAIKRATSSFGEMKQAEIHRKVIAFAGDGASVNTGIHNGVIALFREDIGESVIMIQCLSHRVELAFKQAMKVSPLFVKVDSVLNELFKFYHKSPKQMSNLKSTYEALGMLVTIPTRVGGTRWLSHTKLALNNSWKGYKAIVTHLDQVSIETSASAVQSKAKSLLKSLRSQPVMMFGHFLTDVIDILVKFSMHLQTRETCIYLVHQQQQKFKHI